jgi:hypothetical protein
MAASNQKTRNLIHHIRPLFPTPSTTPPDLLLLLYRYQELSFDCARHLQTGGLGVVVAATVTIVVVVMVVVVAVDGQNSSNLWCWRVAEKRIGGGGGH